MRNIKAKKALGQHFLNDDEVAEFIVNSIKSVDFENLVEIGPGMGILTQFIKDKYTNSFFIEIDAEAIEYLGQKFPDIKDRIVFGDFLRLDLKKLFIGKTVIIGNFPYNISSQILFKVLDNRDMVIEIVGMFQKEVADRIISPPGSKVYGILSVFIQAYFRTEQIMVLGPEKFSPPPKVRSSVIRLSRNNIKELDCDELLFFKLVKLTFNQRRKMIRNSVKLLGVSNDFNSEFLTRRPEQLGVSEFVLLTRQVSAFLNQSKA